MAGRSRAYKTITSALTEETLVPIGTRKAKGDGTARYIPYPQPWARQDGVEKGEEVSYVRHAPTGALVILPPGLPFTEFVAQVDE